MEIGTNTRTTSTTSSTFGLDLGGQPVVTTKLVSPIRGGISLEIIPLLVVTVAILVDTSSFVVNSILRALKFLSTTIPLNPPLIGVGLKLTVISNTPHASLVFMTPIMNFDETPDR
jgi:hypothetical protein